MRKEFFRYMMEAKSMECNIVKSSLNMSYPNPLSISRELLILTNLTAFRYLI